LSKGIVDKISELLKPQAPLWACELTVKHVVVAGVSRNRTRIESTVLRNLGEAVIAGSLTDPNVRDVAATRSSLEQALAEANFKGSEIAVVVPDEATRVAFVKSETLSKDADEQRAFIRWKLKKSVPFDVDSAQIAFRVANKREEQSTAGNATGAEMLVTLAPRSVIEEYERLFEPMEIHAGIVLPSTLAALNLFTPPSGDVLFVKIAPDCVTTSIFQRKQMQFYRRITDASLYDAVYPTILYYQDKLGGTSLQHLFVCQDGAEDAVSVGELQEKLGLPMQPLEPRNVKDVFKPALGAVHLAGSGIL
jgi:type IV pilus assembly protein PilM